MTSVGIDRGLHLTTWRTTIEGALKIDMGKGGGPRPFTVTSHPPDHGRSGGGLFRADGAVLGVCTGYFENKPGQRLGAFAVDGEHPPTGARPIPRNGGSAARSPTLMVVLSEGPRTSASACTGVTSRQDV